VEVGIDLGGRKQDADVVEAIGVDETAQGAKRQIPAVDRMGGV
jgi:hypothetical protein